MFGLKSHVGFHVKLKSSPMFMSAAKLMSESNGSLVMEDMLDSKVGKDFSSLYPELTSTNLSMEVMQHVLLGFMSESKDSLVVVMSGEYVLSLRNQGGLNMELSNRPQTLLASMVLLETEVKLRWSWPVMLFPMSEGRHISKVISSDMLV